MRCFELVRCVEYSMTHRLAIQQSVVEHASLATRHSPLATRSARRDARRDAGHAGGPALDDDGHRADLPGGDRRAQLGPGLPGAGQPASPARLDDPLRPERRHLQADAAQQPQEQPGLPRIRRERVRRHPGRRLRRLHPVHRQGPRRPAVHGADVGAAAYRAPVDRGQQLPTSLPSRSRSPANTPRSSTSSATATSIAACCSWRPSGSRRSSRTVGNVNPNYNSWPPASSRSPWAATGGPHAATR